MKRRNFVLSSLSLAFGAGLASPALARYSCSQPWQFNGGLVRRCSVEAGGRWARAQQACDQWCWAACIETAFSFAGYEVSQPAIVEKLFWAKAYLACQQ